MEGSVVVLDFWPSMFGMRVRIALEEKGISYEYKEMDVFNKDQLLLQMNPIHKRIPVLIHNGIPICESLIILEYIDQVWSSHNHHPLLLPSDPYLRSQARFWAHFIDHKVYMPGRKLTLTKGKEHEEAKREFKEAYKVMEGVLGERRFFGGDEFGFVDVAFIGFSSWFKVFDKYGGFSMEEDYPKLTAWASRCMQKQSVATILSDQDRVTRLADDLIAKLTHK